MAPPKAAAGSDRAALPHDRTLLFAMVRLVNLAARPFQEGIGRSHRLGLSEWRTLAVLHAHPGSAATEIAQRTGLDKMAVSRALGSLEQAGRLVRRPDRRDGRRALATLTPAGRRLFQALSGQARIRDETVTGMLSATEHGRLLALVERMTDALLRADGAGAPPEAAPTLSGIRTGRRAPAGRPPTDGPGRPTAPAPRPRRAAAPRTGTRG